jgi:hypothetical protein
MSRYHFNIRDGGVVTADDEGTEFHNLAAARHEAAETGRHLLIACLKRGRSPERIAIEITDEAGNLLDTLNLTEISAGSLDGGEDFDGYRFARAPW